MAPTKELLKTRATKLEHISRCAAYDARTGTVYYVDSTEDWRIEGMRLFLCAGMNREALHDSVTLTPAPDTFAPIRYTDGGTTVFYPTHQSLSVFLGEFAGELPRNARVQPYATEHSYPIEILLLDDYTATETGNTVVLTHK